MLLTQATLAWANIYSCNSPSGKPFLDQKSIKSELRLSYSEPLFASSYVNRENLEFKTPFLIYYAIDSSEAFMQYSVRFEVAKLQQSCKKNPNVNFVVFLNSMYVNENSFLFCKDKKLSKINLREFPELNKSLIKKRKVISSGDHTEEETGPLKYLVMYFEETNKSFGQFPLAHPDFLYDLVNLVTTNKNFFPNENYAPFLNLKSHGSEDNVLAGMYECQKKAKELSAKKIVSQILNRDEIKFLERLNTPEKVESHIDEYERIISKLDLGIKPGLGEFKSESKLGNERLGNERLGNERLSIMGSGLGVSEGLGGQMAFGTAQIHLGWVLDDLFTEGSNRSLGFLMLEACDTNRDQEFFHTYLTNIFGYYTAKKSLWYRNMNWWEILERSEGKTENLIKILKEETPKIPNIEVVPVQ